MNKPVRDDDNNNKSNKKSVNICSLIHSHGTCQNFRWLWFGHFITLKSHQNYCKWKTIEMWFRFSLMSIQLNLQLHTHTWERPRDTHLFHVPYGLGHWAFGGQKLNFRLIIENGIFRYIERDTCNFIWFCFNEMWRDQFSKIVFIWFRIHCYMSCNCTLCVSHEVWIAGRLFTFFFINVLLALSFSQFGL